MNFCQPINTGAFIHIPKTPYSVKSGTLQEIRDRKAPFNEEGVR